MINKEIRNIMTELKEKIDLQEEQEKLQRELHQELNKPLVTQYREQRIKVLNGLKDGRVTGDRHLFVFYNGTKKFEKEFTNKELKRKYVTDIVLRSDGISVEYRTKAKADKSRSGELSLAV